MAKGATVGNSSHAPNAKQWLRPRGPRAFARIVVLSKVQISRQPIPLNIPLPSARQSPRLVSRRSVELEIALLH